MGFVSSCPDLHILGCKCQLPALKAAPCAGVPTRITLFDEDYAVVRRPEGPLALIDRCCAPRAPRLRPCPLPAPHACLLRRLQHPRIAA